MTLTPPGADPERPPTAAPLDLSATAADPEQVSATVGIPSEAGADRPAAGQGTGVISTAALIEQLQADRLWLLRRIDAGAYPELRLDLAALERELGQLLDLAGERLAGS